MDNIIDFAFPLLTQQTRALQPGTITLIDGDPAADTSPFILQNLIHMHDKGIPVALLSLEEDLPEATLSDISQWIAARTEENNAVIAILGDQKDKYLPARPFMIAARQALKEKSALIVNIKATLSCDFERAAQTILHLQSTARTPAMPFNRILHMHKTRCGHGHGQKIAYNFCGTSLTFQEVGPLETSVNITAQ